MPKETIVEALPDGQARGRSFKAPGQGVRRTVLMPLPWRITINKGPSLSVFIPNPLTEVHVGDPISWTNAYTQAHWPGLKKSDGTINTTYQE